MELHSSNSTALSDLKCSATSKQEDEYIAEEGGGREQTLHPTHSAEIVENEELNPEQDHLIFAIELILEMILENLKICDLLTSRQVNVHCNYVATKLIQTQSPPISLNFTYNSLGKQTYVFSPNKPSISSVQNLNKKNIINCHNNNDLTLPSLSKLMKTSWNFPVNSFSFKKGSLDDNELQIFLSCHGYHIKSLSLELFQKQGEKSSDVHGNRNRPPAVSILRKLLFSQTPHLSSLRLSKFPQNWTNYLKGIMPLSKSIKKSKIAKPKYLNNLTSLQLGKRDERIRILEEIVKFAPSLKAVQTNSFQDVFNDQFNKFHLIRSLYFHPEEENIEEYERLASSLKASVLKSIDINLLGTIVSPEYNDRLSELLWKLLSATALTLITLKLTLPFCLLWTPTSSLKLKFPQLPTLKCIEISTPKFCAFFLAGVSEQFSSTCFRTEFRFDSVFPNATKVVFKVGKWYKNEFYEVLRIDDLERALNVKSLIFTKAFYVPNKCLLYSSHIFQNVKFLEVQLHFCHFLKTSQSGLYDFQHLEELRLVIHLSNKHNKDYYDLCSAHELEAGLIGLTPLDLQEIYPSVSSRFEIGFEAEMVFTRQKEKFSILNLPELKILQLTFVDPSSDVKETYPIFLTQVSRFYAFEMRPLFQVKLSFCFQRQENLNKILEAMEIILPHLQVIDDEGQEIKL